MVESRSRTDTNAVNGTVPIPALRSVLRQVEGMSEERIDNVVTATLTKPPEQPAPEGQPPLFPPVLITLRDAAKAHDRPYSTLWNWVRTGHLAVKERRPGPGNPVILVDEADVIQLVNNPPKMGRPRKIA